MQMKIDIKDFYTQISTLASLDELPSADIGKPCLLIVRDNGGIKTGDEGAVRDFFRKAPFVTALASNEPDAGVSGFFDMVIPAEGVEDYAAEIFKDKSPMQIREITGCFTAARNGSSQDVLDAESRAFYRLIASITGGIANE